MVKGYDITPQLVLSAYNTQIQFCRKQRVSEEGCKRLRGCLYNFVESYKKVEILDRMCSPAKGWQ